MNKESIKDTEEKILNIANLHIESCAKRLESAGIDLDDLSVSRYGAGDEYFSEIEFNLWKNNNLESAFSLIIFMKGKQTIHFENVPNYIDDELLDYL